MFKKLSICILVFFGFCSSAQKHDTAMYVFQTAESEMKVLQKGFLSKKESERIETNKKFIAAWDAIVSNPKILDYNFEGITEASILQPKDKKFKLVTWNLQRDDGTHAYFGYLLVNNSKRVKKGLFRHETIQGYEHFKLLDNSGTIKNPETFVGTPEKWFGMLYYSLVECDGYYTLLGYDPNDKLIRRKFVDVLYFRPDGTPVFGKDVFRFPKKNPRRLMFEYSSDVSMSLRYNDKSGQIIFSHLAPRKEGQLLEGQPQFYGPDGSYDALVMKKEKWNTIEDVDARNEKTDNDKNWNNPRRTNSKKNKQKKMMPGQKAN